MKILYIAPVRDFSGYAAAARGYINALHHAGADLVVRPIRYDRADSGTEYTPNEIETALMKRSLDGVDVIIQHTTPNELRPVEGKTNIAVVAWETNRIPQYWADKLNKFNAVITFCQTSVDAFRDCGVTVPIFKIPHTFDIPSYRLNDIAPIMSPSEPDFFKDRFVFYNISQFSTKKGIDILLKAYFLQFHGKQDKVVLILKTYIDMANRNEENKKLAAFVNSVKAATRLAPDGYPPLMIVTKTFSDHYMKKIHRTGHCYVCSSRAEGWCIPAFEALAYGNKLVTTDWGGMGEFIQIKDKDGNHVSMNADHVGPSYMPNVFPVSYRMEPLVGQGHADPELYTAKDLVAEPSTLSMMYEMQQAYDSPFMPRPSLMEFDYSTVGASMLDVIQSVKNGATINV